MPGKNRRILIVDDHRAIHDDFRKLLMPDTPELDPLEAELFGDAQPAREPMTPFELDSAWQGEEGANMVRAALAEERPYALAFVDMRMPPGWDGLQTVEKIFEYDPRIQVVICTAYSDSSWVEIRERFGLTDRLLILKKPFDLAEICQLACALVEKWHLTQQAHLEARRAHYDPLTGLPNRTLIPELFRQGAQLSLANSDTFALFYIDLDDFKLVNDSFGHTAGDAMLREVTNRLKECGGGERESVARIGGDEFLLFANLESVEAVSELATRLLASIARPIDASGHALYSSASIGISIFPQDGVNLETLVQNADAAMYECKRGQRSSFQLFNGEIGDRARAKIGMRTQLRGALERNEFALYYQPIYSLKNCRMTGSEALIRWTDPMRGTIYPGEFIPVAEESGYIRKIGNWVFEQACTQARQWECAGGEPFRVSINISASQFLSNDLLQRIGNALEMTGANARLLDLELTESVLMRDFEKGAATIRDLRRMGFRVSIDDFGTGYSSFNYLANLPIDTLKLDKSFLSGIQGDFRRGLVLESIVNLAHKLGIVVIAEGIEDADQLRVVRSMGCDEAQGYLLGLPGTADEIERNKVCVPAGFHVSPDLGSLSRFVGAATALMPEDQGALESWPIGATE